MTAFLFGILSSLAASAIILVLGLVRGSRPLWWLVAICSRLTGTGLARVYRHQSSAEGDIARDLGRASWIKVLAGRGNVLTREVFSPLWSGQLSPESFYSSSSHGRDSPCLYARAPGLLYSIALQQFDAAWTNSSSARPTP
jgi:hypothetical protein